LGKVKGVGTATSGKGFPTVRSTTLFKPEIRNRTRLVQKPNWTRFMSKSENVYSSTRTFWPFRDQTNRKSVYRSLYRSTHFHFCPLVSVQFGFCTNLVRFRFSSLNMLFARTARRVASIGLTVFWVYCLGLRSSGLKSIAFCMCSLGVEWGLHSIGGK